MPAFSPSGPAGAAAITTYFGKVPDRLNMAISCQPGAGALTAAGAANLVNQWVPYNQNMYPGGSNVLTASLGATTSAPDGTTNGQKVVESTSNTVHAFLCGVYTDKTAGGFTERLSVFAKAAERTRFALYLYDYNFDPHFTGGTFSQSSGCKTVFDLSAGTVAVANTAVNGSFSLASNPYVAGPAEIVAFGNGWYRCTVDLTYGRLSGNIVNGLVFAILLDNGSGNAAESTVYTGDGSSGVYFWRSTALPPGAWALNNQVFFDDFTTLNTIDLTGGTVAGKNWYLGNANPANNGLSPTDSSKLSIVSGTQLKIGFPSGQADLALATIGYPSLASGTVPIGQVWQPPMLAEISMAWDYQSVTTTINGIETFWTYATEFTSFHQPGSIGGTPQDGKVGQEHDFFEWSGPPGGANPYPVGTLHFETGYGVIATTTVGESAVGVPAWQLDQYYHSGDPVIFGGVAYISTQNSNQGNQPPNASFWSTPYPNNSNPPFVPPVPLTWNATQQNVYSVLWLPNSQSNGIGQILYFMNGVFCYGTNGVTNSLGPHFPYAPAGPQAYLGFIMDSNHFPMLIGTAQDRNTFVDFIRITQ